MVKVTFGTSEKDRIGFFSKTRGVMACRNENGEYDISTADRNSIMKKSIVAFLGIFGSVSLMKACILMPLIEKEIIGIGWYLVSAFFFFVFSIFAIVVVRSVGGEDFLKNHGAEHKVHLAYMKLEKIPTIEEAKTFSRIHKSCGITIYSACFTAQIIGFVVFATTGYAIPELLLFILPIFFQTRFPFNLLGKLAQFFTTKEPEDENIELAIAAITALVNREKLFCELDELCGD